MKSPADLRSQIERDLQPVRPLRPPLRRALIFVPLALATMAGVPILEFFRSDFAELGFVRGWGLSAAQALVGAGLVSAALVESIPGRALSRRTLVMLFALGFALPAVVLALTATSYSIGAGGGWSDVVGCFRMSFYAAIPSLLAATVLVAGALAIRPGFAGALYGLGSGVVADAGLRLFCDFTVPSHVLPGHGGAIAASMVAGIVLAKVGSKRNG